MPRRHSVPIGVLNVAMHAPHSKARYEELIRALFRLGKPIRTRGTSGALLGKLYAESEPESQDAVIGELYTFLYLDPEEPWFNTQRNEEAADEELNELKIPPYLKPHLARFMFVFLVDSHRMYIQLKTGQRSLSINAAALAMKTLLADERMKGFGTVEVTVEPARNTVQKILGMDFLHSLRIELVRPNPDDHQDDEKRLLEELSKRHARKMKYELTSERHEPLKVDEEIKTLARVASSNGYVMGSGRDVNDTHVELSTRDTPFIDRPTYDPKESTLKRFLLDQARRISSHFAT
jgi:hypothetical protein